MRLRKLGLLLSRLPVFVLALALSLPALPSHAATTGEQLSDCNWLVTYRGKVYDLAPLTREALARPIETDLRYALQRVPEANAHLERMSTRQRDAKAHTILASVFMSGLLVTRILESREKREEKKAEIDLISVVSGAFFLGATAFSWKATVDAKSELVKAVDAFNDNSPHKIQPSSPGSRDAELRAPLDLQKP